MDGFLIQIGLFPFVRLRVFHNCGLSTEMAKSSFLEDFNVNYVENRYLNYKVAKYWYLLGFSTVWHKKVYNLEQISTSCTLNGDKIMADI